MRLGGHKAVLVRAIEELLALSYQLLAYLIFKWMNQVGAYLMLDPTFLIHQAETRPYGLVPASS